MSTIPASASGVQKRSVSIELRAEPEFALAGYAAVFNVWSHNLGGFREQLQPGTFSRSIKAGADVKALFNHGADNILGRTKSGTLEVAEDSRGLKFRCQLNKNSQAHRDIYEAVKRGDISECSFAFTVAPGGQSWTNGKDPETGEQIQFRTLTDVDLLDVSVVTYPAYPDTSAGARAQRSRPDYAAGQRRKIAKVNPGAVKILREATKRMVARGLRDIGDHFGDQWDFASQLQYAQSCAEFAHAQLVQARDMWDGDTSDDGFCDPDSPDYDPSYEEDCRNALLMAHTHANLACDHIAGMALRYGGRISAKQIKD